MLNNTCNIGTQETSLQIKQNDKFFSRLLSKENPSSIGAPSFRVYYGGENVNVPFVWETKPGTPKHHTLQDQDHEKYGTILPPLTPPPSYYTTKMPIKKRGKSNFFRNLLPKLIPKKPRLSSSSSSSRSSRSSSSSSESSETSWKSKPTWSPKSQSLTVRSILYDHGMDDEEESRSSMSPTSTLCFGLKMPR
ncbi:hypothetical protein Droror1_Dr00008994 [Drosera rotundifolia]